MARALRHGRPGHPSQLVWVLERCLDDAVYDLAVRGIDLGELWRERRWDYLWTLLVRLPRSSLTKETLSQDEEFMTRILDASGDDSASSIRLSEFTPEVEALYNVTDRLGDVVKGLIGLANGLGGKKRAAPNIPLMRRPETALERVRRDRRRGEHRALVDRLLPGRGDAA